MQQQNGNSSLKCNRSSWKNPDEQIDASFYINKKPNDMSMARDDDSLIPSDDDSVSTCNITVVPSTTLNEAVNVLDSVIELPDTQPLDIAETLKPPLLLCKSFTGGNHFYLVIYEYKAQNPKPIIGTCTLRFSLNDPRIQDRSEETLLQLKLTESDVWIRDSNRGIYDKIDQYSNNL